MKPNFCSRHGIISILITLVINNQIRESDAQVKNKDTIL